MTKLKKNKIAFFGHPGSFTHGAAIAFVNEYSIVPELELPCESIKEVIDFAGQDGYFGVVPIKNSLAGDVEDFKHISPGILEGLSLIEEVTMPIHHCLLVRKEVSSLDDITHVVSHRQALKQCGNFIANHDLQVFYYSNTSTAARALSQGKIPKEYGIIASEDAARIYGLNILLKNLEDAEDNKTTFRIYANQPLQEHDVS